MTFNSARKEKLRVLIRRCAPLLSAAAGFIAGALYCGFFHGENCVISPPDLCSAFESRQPFTELTRLISGELKYAFLIYLLGFCSFGAIACDAVIFLRASLCGFAAVYLLSTAHVSVPLYFMHATFNLLVIGAFCGAGFLCSAQATSGRGDTRDLISYTVKCLFFTGLIFLSVIARHLLMLIF